MEKKTIKQQKLQRVIAQVSDQLETQVRRRLTDRICIGVTGLSQSGKSTFITSLMNQLINHKNARLSAFSPWLTNRIVAVKQHPLEDRFLSQFDYKRAVSKLSGSDAIWPDSTQDISGALIEIKLKSRSKLRGKRTRSVFVEIRDYPGEWLLDLPLLRMSYQEWCIEWKRLLTGAARRDLESNPLSTLEQISPLDPLEGSVVETANTKFVSFLKASRQLDPPLQIVHPGRFLVPGKNAVDQSQQFFPLLALDGIDQSLVKAADEQSYAKVLEKRFEAYKKDAVSVFFKNFIKPVDRQVVLVDVLSLFRGDQHRLEEMIEALEMISQSFEYGERSLFGAKVEKVIFAATKVDQVVAQDHEAVRHLLSAVVRSALDRAAYQEIDYRVEAIAAVRSSHEKKIDSEACIQGTDQNDESIGYVHPEIPPNIPDEADWSRFANWKPPVLKPPKGIRASQDQALPHIRMDQLLQDLLGDLCR